MTSVQFAYWLQGFFEIGNPKEINEEQTLMIKKHLGLVFFHEIDPSYSDDPKVQAEMNKIHDTPPPPPKDKIIVEGEEPEKPSSFGRDESGTLYRC